MSARKATRASKIVLERSTNSAASNGGGDESFGSSTLETSRLQERDHLTSLNSRLATYIDKVRQLEAENNRLQVQIRDIEVVEKKEKSGLHERFEAEKARLRRSLDLANDELAKNKIEYDAAKVELKKLKPQVDKLQRELQGAHEATISAQSAADQSEAKQRTLQKRNDKLFTENEDLKRENITLRDQVEGLKKAVEDETLLRATANNKIKGLEEDLAFALAQHKGELEEVRHKRQVDMTTYAKQVNDEYQSKLQDQLAEMRAQFQGNLAQNKAAFEEAYKNKLNDARERQEAALDEALRLRTRLRDIEATSTGNSALIERLRNELEANKNMFQDKLDDKDSRISELNKEIERLMSEFHDLLDIKTQLDAELRTYQALLEGEEERLNLTQENPRNTSTHHVSFSSGSTSAQRGVKRRRVLEVNGEDQEIDYSNRRSKLHKETTGPIGIDEVDENGQWVRVANSSDEEVMIGGYRLVVKAGNKEASFQFSSRMKLAAGASATVYSAECGVHNPPESYVMKKQQWPIGENPSARLEDTEGDTVSSITVEMTESSDPSDPADRCSIM